MAIDGLVAALRAAARPNAWARGVELARTGAVQVAWSDESEAIAQVRPRSGTLVPTVRLFPTTSDWDCDACDVEACEHAVAAALALADLDTVVPRREDVPAAGTGQPVPGVGYRFERAKTGLVFRRVIVGPPGERPLEPSLAARQRPGSTAEPVAASAFDLELEHAMGSWRGGVLPREVVPRLFALLARGSADVRLDGRPVRIGARAIEPLVARVEDQGDGFRLSIVRHPDIDEYFGAAVRCGDELRPMGEIRLTAPEREQLPRGRHFVPSQVPELVTTILPSLTARVPVEVLTAKLPGTAAVAPRALVETEERAGRLVVRASVVYGRPPLARVEDGRLIHYGGPVPVRDEPAERAVADHLARALDLRPGIEFSFEGEDAVTFGVRLARFGGEVQGDAHQRYVLAPPLVPRFALRGDEAFELSFESRGPDGSVAGHASLAAVIEAWVRGSSYVALDEGGFSPLPMDGLARWGRIAADLLAAREASGRVAPAALPDLAKLCEAFGETPPRSWERLAALAETFERLPEAPLPADLTATLRGYQRQGINWLAFLKDARLGGVLADDMGLGKTLQALAVFEGRVLVVCPASVVFNWEHELARFRPALPVVVYHGPQRALPVEPAIVITTYALLRGDADVLANVAWDVAVLDEAQAIKNPASQVARAAYRLQGAFRLALTGTPVENRLSDLWSLFRFAAPGLFGSEDDFDRRYARPIAAGDPAATARLRERLKPFVLRRLKREVAPELPPRIETALHVELDESERAVYDAVRAASREEVAALLAGGGSVLAALEALLRLRQAACHPALLPGIEPPPSSSKVDALLELLDEAVAEGHKALVFSQWTSLLDLVEPHLRAASIGFTRLDGSTADRQGVVGTFQDANGPPVMLVSLKAGGVGLNLTAADHVVLLDPWWNPATEDQAIDRAHRIGQDRPVIVHRLVARETVEERLLALQEHKRALADAALGGATAAATITRDDLLALLA